MASAVEIVLGQAQRALDDQIAALADARTRSTIVFSVGGIASSFLAGPALKGHKGIPALGFVAIGFLVAAVVAALVVLWPWRFRFTFHPAVLLGAGWGTLDGEQMGRELAAVMGRAHDRNATKLLILWRVVQLAMVLALLSVLMWLILLAKG